MANTAEINKGSTGRRIDQIRVSAMSRSVMNGGLGLQVMGA